MGFSTPAWIRQLPPAPTESALEAGNKGALAGYQLGQMKATRSALQNTDISNPDSVNTAIGALVRAGASDQATSLMNLNFIRDLRSRVPALFDEISGKTAQPAPTPVSQASQTSDGEMTSDQHQHVADTMSQGVDALRAIRALPPEQRAAAFAQAKDAFVQRGIPPEAVDAVGRDLSDAGLDNQIAYLSAHGDHFGARATGAESTAPTMAHPGQYGWASRVMDSPQIQLGIALAKSAGLDLSGLTDTARAMVMPQIEAAAKAAYAEQTARSEATGKALAPPAATITAAPVADPNSPTGYGIVTPPGGVAAATAGADAAALGAAVGGAGGQFGTAPGGARVAVPVQGATDVIAANKAAVAGAEAGATAPFKIETIKMDDGTEVQVTRRSDGTYQQVRPAGAAPAPGGGGAGGPAPNFGHSRSPEANEAALTDAKNYQATFAEATNQQNTTAARQRVQLAEQAIKAATALNPNAFTGRNTQVANIFAGIPGMPPLAGNAGDLATYENLLSQVTKGSFTTFPKTNTEFDAAKTAIGHVTTPADAMKLSMGVIASAARKEVEWRDFVAAHPEYHSYTALQRAWLNTPQARSDTFADPVFRNMTIDGKPAVALAPAGSKYAGWGVWRPGTPYRQTFRVQ